MTNEFPLREHSVRLLNTTVPAEYNADEEILSVIQGYPKISEDILEEIRQHNVKFQIRFRVVGPQQQSAYPWLTQRLEEDFKSSLLVIQCSEGKFLSLLREGRQDLGHIIDHIFELCYDGVLHKISQRFPDQEEMHAIVISYEEEVDEGKTTYRIDIYQSLGIHYGFIHEMVYVVFTYLNHLLTGEPYNLRGRLERMIREYTPQKEENDCPDFCPVC